MRATPSATLNNGTNALLNIGVGYVSISSLGGMELGNTHGATHTGAWSTAAGANYIMTGAVVAVSAEL